ncbi:expressed protein [Batrachochytrium dendrobatidis JAM81]|uniref:Expressed protein n=1 Tax=Batrachochytrium dendrobatidis (strain JAM81 / FGSC 10211) TaxID=684364 RepID=F4NUA3_BATDJ|nr:uncharacterized protein BATDEDRAFT_29180 [Batrachochytrium dendrobatidis JAM81]EGF83984.1 expressed protein [Batrachochytrium dendrobatidis JAM81]|eukprot:XP_006675628.1 expressed protein [Batrachochytrium dendrobatidis JAM81]
MAASRILAVQQLRDKIFHIDRAALGMRTGSDILAKASMRQKLLHHYPPNIDLLALSSQDPRLKPLQLQDVWQEEKWSESLAMVTGVLKREQKDTKGKSKKRK